MKKMQLTAITAALGATMLSGCASIDKANKNIVEANDITAKIYKGAQDKVTSASQDPTREPLANFGKIKKNWVNPIPLKKSELFADREFLPKLFKEEVILTLPGKVSLIEIISELQRSTKNNFTISQDVYNSSNGTGSIISATGGNQTATPQDQSKNDPISRTLGTGGAIPIYVNDFVFRGTLEQALDLISSKANVGWKWNGNSIEVFRFETKSYNIASLSGNTDTRANIDIQSDDAGGGGSSSSNDKGASAKAGSGVSRTNNYNAWNEVRSYLMALLSPNGSMAVMESTGMVTVKDSPSVHLQLAKSVKDLNNVLGKQVHMDIKVYAVNISDEDNYGVNWNAVWQTAGSGLKLNLGNVAQNISNATGITAGVTSGPFTGTSLMVQALSTIGQASLLNEFSITTLNGQPTPIGNNRKIAYIESITKEKTGNTDTGTSSITVKPGAVYQGIGMNVTPRLQVGTDKLLLEYTLSLNDVEKLESFTTGEGQNSATVQLPTTTIKNILQRASLRSGQTLVLSGFKQTTSGITNSGVGSANNPIFGGTKNGKNSSQYLVITVTPYVAQDNE